MIVGIGCDVIEVERIRKAIDRGGFLERVYTPEELEFCTTEQGRHKYESLAARFAAKEAFLKAVGTGLGGFALCDLAVLRRESGAPYFALTGPAAAWAAEQGVTVHLSLTHERGLANAIVILEKV